MSSSFAPDWFTMILRNDWTASSCSGPSTRMATRFTGQTRSMPAFSRAAMTASTTRRTTSMYTFISSSVSLRPIISPWVVTASRSCVWSSSRPALYDATAFWTHAEASAKSFDSITERAVRTKSAPSSSGSASATR